MSFSGWKECTLGDVCALGDGAHTKVKRMESGIPYLTSKNIKSGYIDLGNISYMDKGDYDRLFGESQKSVRHLQKDDVLVGIIGTLGNCYLYKENDEFGISSSIGIIRPNKEVLYPKYLYYIINSKRFLSLIQNFKGGSVQAYTNLPTLRNVPITVPPIAEQKYIAKILSTLDEKIENNNQINKRLEEMAQVIFKQWFVDFEFPNEDGEPYKSSGGEMVESEIGMIPTGWELVEVSSIFNVKDGTHNSPKTVDDGYPLITSKHLMDTKLDFQSSNRISKTDYDEVNKRSKVDRYDILISMIGTVGNLYLVQNEEIKFAIKNVGLFKTSENLELYEYIYCYLKTPLIKQYIKERMAGSTQQYISLGELRKIPIILPKETKVDLMKAFKKIANPIFNEIYMISNEIGKLTEIRDNLLPKLMSGEIRVPLNN